MRKFLTEIILAFAMTVIVVTAISVMHYLFVGNVYEQSYNARLIDKLNRAKEINNPKIILVGDSNVSFGIDSQLIGERTGMEVVNLGLYRSLGNRFAEDCCKESLKSGDIVIIMHSSFNDNGKMIDPNIGWLTLEYHNLIWDVVSPQDYYSLLCAYPYYIRNTTYLKATGGFVVDSNSSYKRDAFNEFGDIVFKPEAGQYSIEQLDNEQTVTPNSLEISDICVERINELNRFVSDKGATLLIASYPVYVSDNTPSKENYRRFQAELQERMDCKVISDYTDYFYSPEYFYNSILHLTEEGARIRTKQLIEDYNKWSEN